MTVSRRLRRGDVPFYLLAVVVNLVALGHVVLDAPGWDVVAIEAGTTASLSLGFVRTVIDQSGGSIVAPRTDASWTTIQIELPTEPTT